jgi:hypothetical protein
LPSVAVLLAKSDMLYKQGVPCRDPDKIRQDVWELLPAAFDLGWKSGYFPVSIGEFTKQDGENRLIALHPNGVAVPIFFAVACFLKDHQQVLHMELQMIAADRKKVVERHTFLNKWPKFIRWFLQGRIAAVQAELDVMNTQIRAYDERLHVLTEELCDLWQWLRPALWSRPR